MDSAIPIRGDGRGLGSGILAAETNTLGLFRIIAPLSEVGETTARFDGANVTGQRQADGFSGRVPMIHDLSVFVNGEAGTIFRDISLLELDVTGVADLNNPFGSVVIGR